MHERPPECETCPHPIQTRLCCFHETGVDEWVCCKSCPRLAALDPGEHPTAATLEKDSPMRPEGLNHSPEVMAYLRREKLIPSSDGDDQESQDQNQPSSVSIRTALQAELHHALHEERYEDAARLRDFLQEFEKNG
jgi:hypothetical protein